MEGNNKPQTDAILDSIRKDVFEKHSFEAQISRDKDSGWFAADFGKFLI